MCDKKTCLNAPESHFPTYNAKISEYFTEKYSQSYVDRQINEAEEERRRIEVREIFKEQRKYYPISEENQRLLKMIQDSINNTKNH